MTHLSVYQLGVDDLKDSYGRTAVYYAASENQVKALEYLHTNGAQLDSRDTLVGAQPIHIAARLGYTETVRFLLNRGIDPDATTHNGTTPLHMWAMTGFPVPEDLLRRGASLLARKESSETVLEIVLKAKPLEYTRQVIETALQYQQDARVSFLMGLHQRAGRGSSLHNVFCREYRTIADVNPIGHHVFQFLFKDPIPTLLEQAPFDDLVVQSKCKIQTQEIPIAASISIPVRTLPVTTTAPATPPPMILHRRRSSPVRLPGAPWVSSFAVIPSPVLKKMQQSTSTKICRHVHESTLELGDEMQGPESESSSRFLMGDILNADFIAGHHDSDDEEIKRSDHHHPPITKSRKRKVAKMKRVYGYWMSFVQERCQCCPYCEQRFGVDDDRQRSLHSWKHYDELVDLDRSLVSRSRSYSDDVLVSVYPIPSAPPPLALHGAGSDPTSADAAGAGGGPGPIPTLYNQL